MSQEFQDVIFKSINALEDLKTNRSPNISKHYSTHRIARIQFLEDTILLYETHKPLPWKISKFTGLIESQAAYNENDIPFLTQLYGKKVHMFLQILKVKDVFEHVQILNYRV